MYYAYIDNAGVCVGICFSSEEKIGADIVPISKGENVQIGDIYADGVWTKSQTIPVFLNDTEKQLAELKENQLILMNAVATLYETMTGGGA